jgi:hypothetical protein
MAPNRPPDDLTALRLVSRCDRRAVTCSFVVTLAEICARAEALCVVVAPTSTVRPPSRTTAVIVYSMRPGVADVEHGGGDLGMAVRDDDALTARSGVHDARQPLRRLTGDADLDLAHRVGNSARTGGPGWNGSPSTTGTAWVYDVEPCQQRYPPGILDLPQANVVVPWFETWVPISRGRGRWWQGDRFPGARRMCG